jgi:hypothetical protein
MHVQKPGLHGGRVAMSEARIIKLANARRQDALAEGCPQGRAFWIAAKTVRDVKGTQEGKLFLSSDRQ